MVVISSHALFQEVCDEKRFHKVIMGPLQELRKFVKDALFTAHNGEPNWGIARTHILF